MSALSNRSWLSLPDPPPLMTQRTDLHEKSDVSLNCNDNVLKSGGWVVWVHFLSSYPNLLASSVRCPIMSTWSRYTLYRDRQRVREADRHRQPVFINAGVTVVESIYIRPILMWIVWFFEYCLLYELRATQTYSWHRQALIRTESCHHITTRDDVKAF